MRQIKLFLVSPSDVAEERDIVSGVVTQELNRIFSDERLLERELCFYLEALRWETHTWPGVGRDAQDVINSQIPDYDIFLGIMWKRFGTPTGRSSSGTLEEFERAYASFRQTGRPHIMFYFRTEGVYPDGPDELEQLAKVIGFKKRLEDLGVAYKRYDSLVSFERYVREHLVKQLLLGVRAATDSTGAVGRVPSLYPEQVFISYVREDSQEALRLYEDLTSAGFNVWIDRENLLPGERWGDSIQKAIRSSRYFIALLSKSSIGKRSFFQKEMRYALEILDVIPEQEIFLVPVRLDDCIPEHPRLRALHWLDLFPSWEAGVRALIGSLRAQSGALLNKGAPIPGGRADG